MLLSVRINDSVRKEILRLKIRAATEEWIRNSGGELPTTLI